MAPLASAILVDVSSHAISVGGLIAELRQSTLIFYNSLITFICEHLTACFLPAVFDDHGAQIALIHPEGVHGLLKKS